MVVNQRIHVGFAHAGQIVNIEVHDHLLHITHPDTGETLATIARTTTSEVTRFKSYGSTNP